MRAIDQAGNTDATPASSTWTVDTTAPVVSIESGPSGLTNNSTPTFTFSSEAGSGFECSIDTGTPAFGPCSGANSHTPSSPLADGPYTFRVRARDAVLNESVATRSFTVDVSAPAAPSLTATAPASPANHNSPKITGAAPTDSTVRIYTTVDCSGSPIATVSAAELASGVTVSVPDDSTTAFRATSTSLAGNPSACSSPITYVEDSTSPQTQIDTQPPAPSNSSSASFTFSGTDTGGSGVASFQCRLDSTQLADWGSCTSPRNLSSLADGSHKFEVRAIDQAGNIDATPASSTWTVDTVGPAAPALSSTTPASPANNNSPKIFGSAPAGTTVHLYPNANCSGLALTDIPAADLQTGVAVSVADNSSTSFSATATSSAANTSPCSSALTYVEDSAPPDTQITAGPPAQSDSSTASLAFTGSDGSGSGVAAFECGIDSGPWTPCSSPKEYSDLAEGSHLFEVRASDVASNTDPTPAALEWVVDSSTTQPTPKPEPTSESKPTPAGQAQLVRVVRNTRKGTAFVIFKITGPGKFSTRAAPLSEVVPKSHKSDARAAARIREVRQRQRGIKPVTMSAVGAGEVSVPIKLTGLGKRILRRERSLKARVNISFVAADGSTTIWKLNVTLKKRLSSAGKPPKFGPRRGR